MQSRTCSTCERSTQLAAHPARPGQQRQSSPLLQPSAAKAPGCTAAPRVLTPPLGISSHHSMRPCHHTMTAPLGEQRQGATAREVGLPLAFRDKHRTHPALSSDQVITTASLIAAPADLLEPGATLSPGQCNQTMVLPGLCTPVSRLSCNCSHLLQVRHRPQWAVPLCPCQQRSAASHSGNKNKVKRSALLGSALTCLVSASSSHGQC